MGSEMCIRDSWWVAPLARPAWVWGLLAVLQFGATAWQEWSSQSASFVQYSHWAGGFPCGFFRMCGFISVCVCVCVCSINSTFLNLPMSPLLGRPGAGIALPISQRRRASPESAAVRARTGLDTQRDPGRPATSMAIYGVAVEHFSEFVWQFCENI